MDQNLDITAEAMKYLVELGCENRGVEQLIINGKTYVTKSIVELRPQEDLPRPICFITFSIQGLVDYLKADIDNLFDTFARLLVKVKSPTEVFVLSTSYGLKNIRDELVYCKASVPEIRYDKYFDSEEFVIQLQTLFIVDDNRQKLLKLVSNLKEDQINEVADDGFSKRVSVKAGISATGTTRVENPVYLCPIRTFHEIEQPQSPFVLRIQEGPEVALFKADGGAWEIEAVANVAAWLKKALEGMAVDVIA